MGSVRNGSCVLPAEKPSGGDSRQVQRLREDHGVVHLTAGSAGAGVEKCGFDRTGAHGNFSVVQSNQWGYLRAHATRDNFSLSFISDALGTEYDQFVLYR